MKIYGIEAIYWWQFSEEVDLKAQEFFLSEDTRDNRYEEMIKEGEIQSSNKDETIIRVRNGYSNISKTEHEVNES